MPIDAAAGGAGDREVDPIRAHRVGELDAAGGVLVACDLEHIHLRGDVIEDEPDLEAVRRFPDVLSEGEEVVLTEKVHGANARYLFHEGRLWVGSHTRIKRRDPKNLWWKPAIALDLERRLAAFPGIAIYGEVYGRVQDLRYGAKDDGVSLVLFDAQDVTTRSYLDHDDFVRLARTLELPTVPVLHRGPWSQDLRALSNGPTVIGAGAHCREGFVARPVKERFDERVGRVALKLHGEDYLLRKSR